jgi:ABC-type transport system involved in cytochrome c biogenesis permease subunit
MIIYVIAFLLAVFSWLKWPDALGSAAFRLVGLAWVLATVGIATRMWLEGRPPVTNLYSSALFIGWGAVALCLVLEVTYRNAIGSVAAGLIGFGTLLIAHHLALGGDTLEMMRAVLDSNFWLATHVVTVTVGYSATFLAGFLALIYVIRGVLTRSLDAATADSLARMVYGVVCFATVLSFVGTVLGGIWADQSWGRFWGWDPKENGALIIVLWNALILHARWGGMVKQRGLMALAIFGNIVTAWSWFGVNMLGVGLHSYGFIDAAFWWLLGFVISQVCFILAANLPMKAWRSSATLTA